MLRVLFGLAVAHTACWGVGHDVTDMSCNLQKRRPDADLHLELELRKPALELADFAMPAASTESARPALLAEGPSSPWLMPGVHFQQCSRPKAKRPTRSLLQTRGQSTEEPLPNRVICPPGQMAIGNFVGDAYQAYHFTCCDAGQQCGGCRKVVNGTCQECAAGYIHQQIPILNITKCFMCDDVPGWQDANGLSCRDYETKGYCPGYVKSGHDEPFHGVRPSEACCACGGGDVLATPTVMRFGYMAVASGDTIDEFPEPQALGTEVSSCNLAQWGLNLTGSGRIQGIVTSLSQNRTSIKCSLVLMQDPMRGISTTADLDVSVGTFSYGEQVLVFKYWGLESEPSSKAFHVHQQTLPQGHSLENFQLNCNCPWLRMLSNGTLVAGPLPTPLEVQGPSLTKLSGMPSCGCEVSAEQVQDAGTSRQSAVSQESSSFIVLQGRLWKSGAYKVPVLRSRIGVPLEISPLQERIPGMRWYEDKTLEFPVLENASSGERFVVSPAVRPEILDVQCRDGTNATYAWSRHSGDVTREGKVALNLDPSSGHASGVSLLDLSAEGRGRLQINCSVALGGQLYDKVLPVATLTMDVVDDMCWVPTNISGWFGWETLPSLKDCLHLCRERADCAAVHIEEDGNRTCRAVVSDGQKEAFAGQVLMRLENCSEEDTDLNLTAKGAWYVQGSYAPSNVFKEQVSYSHPGTTPELQFHLVKREFADMQIPKACENASWLLLHTNSSDFKRGRLEAPEYYGKVMACTDKDAGDVVANAFEIGSENFELNFLPAELDDDAILQKPKAEQQAELKPLVRSCELPDSTSFIFGTLQDPEHFSLHPCECFGEKHAQAAPVADSSNLQVPRSGRFNNGTVEDQKIFSGAYTCEDTATLSQSFAVTLSDCASACRGNASCAFYQFTKSTETCTLFERCDLIQQLVVQMVNDLYGIWPTGNFCLIANPEQCWKEIKRRSYLSLTPSAVPRCLFQDQYDACDALQQISGVEAGTCERCQYIDASSEYAAKGMRKEPLPSSFPSASQISVGCNYTTRMFSRQEDDLKWLGPRPTTVFTCVSGEWVGELGPWQHLGNLSCQECIQVGTPSLGSFSNINLPEVYFLEHRLMQVNYASSSGPGCLSASWKTRSPLVLRLRGSNDQELRVLRACGSNQIILQASCSEEASYWQDADLFLHAESPESQTCLFQRDNSLWLDVCGPDALRLERQQLVSDAGCVLAEADDSGDASITVADCSAVKDQSWYFEKGDCLFGMDMVDAVDRKWNFSVPSEGGELGVQLLKFMPETRHSEKDFVWIGMFGGPWEINLAVQQEDSGKLTPVTEEYKASSREGGFVKRNVPGHGWTLAYYRSAQDEEPYYLYDDGGNPASLQLMQYGIADLPNTSFFWEIPDDNRSMIQNKGTGKCLKAPTAPTSMDASKGNGTDCGPDGLLAALDGGEKCASLDNFTDWTKQGTTCLEPFWSTAYDFSCPDGTAMQSTTFPFPVAGSSESLNFSYTCCTPEFSYLQWASGTTPPGIYLTCSDGFLVGLFYSQTGKYDSSITCMGSSFVALDSSRQTLTAGTCDGDDIFQQWEFVEDAQEAQAPDAQETMGDVVSFSSCEASLALDASVSTVTASDLALRIWDDEHLNTQQRQVYQYVTHYEVVIPKRDGNGAEVLFVCQSAESGQGSLCSSKAAVSQEDLSKLYATAATLKIEKVCPVLLNTSFPVNESVAKPMVPNGITLKALAGVMRGAPYKTLPFDNAANPPFYYNGASGQRAQTVGYLSVPASGDAFWGMSCPPGAVVVSQEKTLPHCLDIKAAATQEVQSSYSGSVTCPSGYAVSGWYNLPGIKVQRLGDAGGPPDWTELKVFCRRTALIGFCENPAKPHCSAGHVVNAISYSQNQFKLGCCRFFWPMGVSLMPYGRTANPYLDFEGYYCPAEMGSTGSALYQKTAMGALGEPGTSSDMDFSLVWDKFRGDWILRKGTDELYAVHSALSPVEITDGPISATSIGLLISESEPQVKRQTHWKKPSYPELMEFTATQADYKEYCSPKFLEHPNLYKGDISKMNPCYHTFNAKMVQGGTKTGITERAFWRCSHRSKERTYMKATAENKQEQGAQDFIVQQARLQKAQLALELAAAVVGAIPWGNWGMDGVEAAKETGEASKQAAAKEVKEAVHAEERHSLSSPHFLESEDETIKVEHDKLIVEGDSSLDGGWDFLDDEGIQKSPLSKEPNIFQKAQKKFAKWGTLQNNLQSALDLGGKIAGTTRTLKASSAESTSSSAKEMVGKTLPIFESTDNEVSYKKKLADAAAADCLPLQYGLSKVMCDLFCVQDSVRAGTEAVLESLQESHTILMQNLEALMDYQTNYILWGVGTMVTSAPTAQDGELRGEAPPQPSTLLSELQDIDFESMKATAPRLSRDILHWHESAGQHLYERLASLTVNATKQSWPLRVKAARGMLHHFQASFQQRLRHGARAPPVADKMRLLREDTAQQRKLADKAQALKFDLSLRTFPVPLVEALQRCHEKHSAYVMLHSKALHQMDEALAAARGFTRCETDTKALQEAWQLAIRADERSQESLLEAWAATVTAAESIQDALRDDDVLSLLGDWTKDVEVEVTCQNVTSLAWQSQALATSALDRAAWALTKQVITFQALAVYQQQQLQTKQLEHVAMPDAWEAVRIQLAAAADPGQRLGQRLAREALQALGMEFCPAPLGCVRGFLVGADVGGAVRCEHAGDGAFVLPKHHVSQLIQEMALRPKMLRSLALMQMVEDQVR